MTSSTSTSAGAGPSPPAPRAGRAGRRTAPPRARRRARTTAACRRRTRRPGGGGRRAAGHLAELGGEQRRGERVPGDLRCDRVDAVVVGGAEQGQRTAVRGAGDADPRVAVGVLDDVVALGEDVDQRGEVGDLVAGVVQPDQAGALAEPARREGEDDVAALGQRLGVVGHRLLAAAEAVRQHHGRGRAVGRREVERGVELDGVGTGARRDPRLLGAHLVGRRRGGGADDEAGDQQGQQDGERTPGAGARAHGPAGATHEAANGRRAVGFRAPLAAGVRASSRRRRR